MKNVKIINKISMNGEYIDAEKITKSEREKISRVLNERVMERLGFKILK